MNKIILLFLLVLAACQNPAPVPKLTSIPNRGDIWVYQTEDPFEKPDTAIVLEVRGGFVKFCTSTSKPEDWVSMDMETFVCGSHRIGTFLFENQGQIINQPPSHSDKRTDKAK